jgi:IstB-like ATP binding protein
MLAPFCAPSRSHDALPSSKLPGGHMGHKRRWNRWVRRSVSFCDGTRLPVSGERSAVPRSMASPLRIRKVPSEIHFSLRRWLDRADLEPGVLRLGQVFADQVVAAAILDRLLHHATVVNIKGKSYRMRRHQSQLEGERRGRL